VREDLVIGWSRTSRTHVEIAEETYRIRDSSWVWWFRPQNYGRQICRVWASKPMEALGAARSIIRELASRRSFLVKGLWLSDARNST
jgi:hypothetical protein